MLARPSAGPISSAYGTRRLANEPVTFHGGTDFVGAPGSPIRAVAAGMVVTSAPNGTYNRYGNVVVIKHDDPREAPYSLYAHMSALKVRKGQRVKPGQIIGAMGNTSATAMEPWRTVRTHLHFELLKAWPAPPDVGRVNSTVFFAPKPAPLPTQYATSPALYPLYSGPTLYTQASPLTGLGASDSLNPFWGYLAVIGWAGYMIGRRAATAR